MSLRDQIANADDLFSERVEVPEWGMTITLKSPTVAARAKMLGRFVSADGTFSSDNLSEMYPALLIATCVDDDGVPLFTDADADLIRSKNGMVVERIATVALRLCGMTDDAVSTGKDD